MITISAVDREISDEELRRIGSIVSELPPFEGYNRDWLVDEAQACGRYLVKPDGLHTVLRLVKGNAAASPYETAYVLAAEVAASDSTSAKKKFAVWSCLPRRSRSTS